MLIKKPNWGTCKQPGVIADDSNVQLLSPDSPVQTGMNVVAKYGQSDVSLLITKINPSGDFIATVHGFGPINIKPPSDLSEGNEVLIDREHICWLVP